MTVSKSLRQLEDLKLISRKADNEDGRASRSRILQKGAALAKQAVTLVELIDCEVFGVPNSDDAQALALLLRGANRKAMQLS